MKTFWLSLPDWVRRIIHTGWQAALGAGVAYWAAQEWVFDLDGAREMIFVAVSAAGAAIKAYLIKMSGRKLQ